MKIKNSKLQRVYRAIAPLTPRLSNERGLSLIAVMWIVAILTVMASEFMYSMQLEIRIARNWSDQVSVFYVVKGGIETAIATLRDDETEYDSLDEDWTDGFSGELNDSTYETTITDESAKINVNTADEETLTKAAIAYYTISSGGEKSEAEMAAEAETLVASIIEKRPFRTVAELAKVDGMTSEMLYGESSETSDDEEVVANVEEDEKESVILLDLATVYSVDKNVAYDGSERVNINSADSSQIQQGINPEGEEIITQQEAQAIVDYREEIGNNQSNQGGGPGQGAVPGQTGGVGQGGNDQESGFSSLALLLDVPAISQNTFDSIRERISVEDEEVEGEDRGEQKININTADAGQLQNLDGIDNGIADSIIRYREQNQFGSIDDIRQVKLISLDEMKSIIDKITISDEQVLSGMVNINTAPLEILAILPGLDEEKAQAIIDRRTVPEGQASVITQQGDQEEGPFTSIGQLLDVEGLDENTFRSIVDHVTYRSHAYRIESEGRSSDRKIVQNLITVVDRSGNRVNTKYWKQE